MKRLKSLLILLALGTSLALGGYVHWLRGQNATLEGRNQTMAEQLMRDQQNRESQERTVASLRGELATQRQRCTSGADELKANIDAFAKQAASCELVKRSLHYTQS